MSDKPRSYYEALPLDERLDVMVESCSGVEIECGWWATDNRASYKQLVYRITWTCITWTECAYGRTVQEAMEAAWKRWLDFEADFNGFAPEPGPEFTITAAGTIKDGVATVFDVG